jgi:hypothetical protein
MSDVLREADDRMIGMSQLADVLDVYAEQRLSPTSPVLARMRAHVLAEVAERQAAAEIAEQHDVLVLPWRRKMRNRLIAVGMAAAMTIGITASVVAAPPGSAFYSARVWLETAFLPTNAAARTAAHEDRLEQRLHEAEIAAANGDAGAVAAAIAAYNDEVEAALADVGSDPDRLAHLEDVLGKHIAVLTALQALVPSQAAGAISHAIDVSSNAQERVVKAHDHHGKPDAPPGQNR